MIGENKAHAERPYHVRHVYLCRPIGRRRTLNDSFYQLTRETVKSDDDSNGTRTSKSYALAQETYTISIKTTRARKHKGSLGGNDVEFVW